MKRNNYKDYRVVQVTTEAKNTIAVDECFNLDSTEDIKLLPPVTMDEEIELPRSNAAPSREKISDHFKNLNSFDWIDYGNCVDI